MFVCVSRRHETKLKEYRWLHNSGSRARGRKTVIFFVSISPLLERDEAARGGTESSAAVRSRAVGHGELA